MGIARSMIDAGRWLDGMRSVTQGRVTDEPMPDLSDLPYGQLGLPQFETERLLARHLERQGVAVERGVALAGLEQEAAVVRAVLDREGRLETASFDYLIGCDGAHSAVRRALGVAFEGDAFPMEFMLGDVAIAWDLPRGRALRALKINPGAAPDMFIAIPLSEPGRYRVSMMAPPDLATPADGTDHGIQSERSTPTLRHLQAVADALVPGAPVLSDMRWSSIFRISMRLAARYRVGRCLIAGDAAHIHPPTGGQGMNTGIQDAYNLAWKLALVVQAKADPALLDSYEAERRPVGKETIERTLAASVRLGRESGARDRLADTQIRVSYRGGDWVAEGLPGHPGPAAGDRAPDGNGLRRRRVHFPLRMFDILRGTEHVLLVPVDAAEAAGEGHLERLAATVLPRLADRVRIVAVAPAGRAPAERHRIQTLTDAEGSFAAAYGTAAARLVRPDGHIGWRGALDDAAGLAAHLARLFPRRA
jgi:2-polyprenyl-6-methoxyphenol hydroxylase-like FAD-dependent oxidoreductase